MRIIFLGPPGSGKGTQAHLVSMKYNIPNISAGEILRQSFMHNQEIMSTSCNNNSYMMDSGNLVDNTLVIKLVINRLNQKDCVNGFLLDGFPRTIIQAESINQYNIPISAVIVFHISDSVIIDRIIGRQIHVASGRTYHIKFNPPKHHGVDDFTGDKLTIRKDDNKKTLQQRLIQYRQCTEPLLDYYYKQSKQGMLNYFVINSNRSITQIYKELISIFQKIN